MKLGIVSNKLKPVYFLLLQKHVDDGFGPNGRTMCDRIIRACNQRLGSGTVDPAHQEKIVELVELAVQGFESLEESGMQSNSFYLEKIVFHNLQKVTSLGAHGPACRLGQLMYRRLKRFSAEVQCAWWQFPQDHESWPVLFIFHYSIPL